MPTPPQSLRHLLGASYTGGTLTFPTSSTLLIPTSGRLQYIDLTHGRAQTLPFEATRDLNAVTLSPKGDVAVVVDTLNRITVVTIPGGRVTARMSLRMDVTGVQMSPCGKLLAVASSDAVEIWRMPRVATPVYGAFDRVAHFNRGGRALCWSADSKHVGVGGRDGVVAVFTMGESGKVRPAVLYGHRDEVIMTAFCGERGMLSLSADGVLFCWRLRRVGEGGEGETYVDDRNSGKEGVFVPLQARLMSRHFVKRMAKKVCSAALGGSILSVGLSNGVFAMFELPMHMTKEDETVDRGLFELDSQHIAFTDLTLLHTLSVSTNAITSLTFNQGNDWLALACAQSAQVVVWEWRSETHILKQQAHILSPTCAAFSPDGRAIATGSKDGRVKLWGVATGFCVATFKDHEGGVSAITFAANDVVVSAGLDGSVRAFDIRRYVNFRIMVAPPPRRQFGCVAVDEAGELVAAGCVDSFEVVVWSLRTGQVVEILNGHKGPVSGVAFRPRRGTLVSSSWDCTVRVWDMYERKGSCEVLEHSKEVLDVAMRPDGKEFASCTSSGEILMWDVERGVVMGTLDGGRDVAGGRLREGRNVAEGKGKFETICYTADGRFLLGGGNRFVCVFLVAEGRRPCLVDRVVTTGNRAFDGVVDKLNSKELTVGGIGLDSIADEDGWGDWDDVRKEDTKSLPGAVSERMLRRKKMLKAEVRGVDACATGRLWAAVTTEGVLVYGDQGGNDDVFDPTNLEVDITPESVRATTDRKEFALAMSMALRLNERASLNFVVENVPLDIVSLVVDKVPTVFFSRLVLLFAWRLENTPHLEVNLTWARLLLLAKGGTAHGGTDPAAVNTALRALHRACAAHSKRLVPLADGNVHMLGYLITMGSLRNSAAGENVALVQ